MCNKWIATSADETFRIGHKWGSTLKAPCLIAFSGDLGAGKTTFIRGMADAFAIDPYTVSSPTFTYLNIYRGRETIYHFDLYRLTNAQAFLSAGFDDLLQETAICCIEWAERIDGVLKEPIHKISITILSEEQREICLH